MNDVGRRIERIGRNIVLALLEIPRASATTRRWTRRVIADDLVSPAAPPYFPAPYPGGIKRRRTTPENDHREHTRAPLAAEDRWRVTESRLIKPPEKSTRERGGRLMNYWKCARGVNYRRRRSPESLPVALKSEESLLRVALRGSRSFSAG